MSKVKYKYDSETLAYVPIESKKSKQAVYGFLFLLASALMGLLWLFVFGLMDVQTPNVKKLKRENENLTLNYKLISKQLKESQAVLNDIENRDNNIYRTYFDANPISMTKRKSGFGGVNRYKDLEGYNNSDLIIETRKKIDQFRKELAVQSTSFDEIAQLAKEKESLLARIPAIQPVRNKDLTRIASGWGWRSDPFTKARKFHYGMDFTAKTGTPVYASGDGKIKRADNNSSGYGNHVRIDHGNGYVSLYAHLSRYNVHKGQKVKRGDIVGFVGSTGRSTGPHLHYEIFKDGERINPLNFYYGHLTPDEFEEMRKAAEEQNTSLD